MAGGTTPIDDDEGSGISEDEIDYGPHPPSTPNQGCMVFIGAGIALLLSAAGAMAMYFG